MLNPVLPTRYFDALQQIRESRAILPPVQPLKEPYLPFVMRVLLSRIRTPFSSFHCNEVGASLVG